MSRQIGDIIEIPTRLLNRVFQTLMPRSLNCGKSSSEIAGNRSLSRSRFVSNQQVRLFRCKGASDVAPNVVLEAADARASQRTEDAVHSPFVIT